MSETEPNTSADNASFDELVEDIHRTTELAKIADVASGEHPRNELLVPDRRLHFGSDETSDKQTVTNLGRHQTPGRVDYIKSGRNDSGEDQIISRVETRHTPAEYKVQLHQPNVDEFGRFAKRLDEPEQRSDVQAYSRFVRAEDGTISVESTINGETTHDQEEARWIAAIALGEVRKEAVKRINAERYKNDARWHEEAKQANNDRSVRDKIRGRGKVSKAEVMRDEAERENAERDARKAVDQAERIAA